MPIAHNVCPATPLTYRHYTGAPTARKTAGRKTAAASWSSKSGPHQIRDNLLLSRCKPHGNTRNRVTLSLRRPARKYGHGIPAKKIANHENASSNTHSPTGAILVPWPTAFSRPFYLRQTWSTRGDDRYRTYRDHNQRRLPVCHGQFPAPATPTDLWELYTAGSPEESAAAGRLTAGLMHYQEHFFVDDSAIHRLEGYLKFLGGHDRIFNRNLAAVPESTGARYTPVRLYCSHDFRPPSAPPTNASSSYHSGARHRARHEPSTMLVDAVRFAAWGGASDEGNRRRRNSDFYMGDTSPATNRDLPAGRSGPSLRQHRWGGMIGVCRITPKG